MNGRLGMDWAKKGGSPEVAGAVNGETEGRAFIVRATIYRY